MSKKILICVAIPVVFFILWLGFLEYKKFTAADVVIAARGYDPLDFFRGRYIYLQLDWENSDCGQFYDNKCPEYDFENAYRFYINEKIADELDSKIRNMGIDEDALISSVDLVFAYSMGAEPVLKGMLINKTPYIEWYKQNIR